jgi:hypothetical protein
LRARPFDGSVEVKRSSALKAYQTLQLHWRETGAIVPTTEPAAEAVGALERKYGIRFPDDFREYLLHACPKDDFWDEQMTIWWPLSRIKNIPEEYAHRVRDEAIARCANKYFFFADYMIWCWAWAIACTEDVNRGRIVVISGYDRFVANSFAEFVDQYVVDNHQLV